MERMPLEAKGRGWGYTFISQGILKMASKPPDAKRERHGTNSYSLQKEWTPLTP